MSKHTQKNKSAETNKPNTQCEPRHTHAQQQQQIGNLIRKFMYTMTAGERQNIIFMYYYLVCFRTIKADALLHENKWPTKIPKRNLNNFWCMFNNNRFAVGLLNVLPLFSE